MKFHGCLQLADVSPLGPGLAGLEQLQSLVMDFRRCSPLATAVLRRLATSTGKLPFGVEQGCGQITVYVGAPVARSS